MKPYTPIVHYKKNRVLPTVDDDDVNSNSLVLVDFKLLKHCLVPHKTEKGISYIDG